MIVVVQCGGKKQARPARARDLYTGPLFRACLRACLRAQPRKWFIASAKWGLVPPDRILEPYEQTLPPKGDESWGARIRAEISTHLLPGEPILALASRRYLVGWADALGAISPLVNLPIGKMIQKANAL